MKITVIGAGNVGATTAQLIANRELANEVVLVDIIDGVPQGKSLDMYESMPVNDSDTKIFGTNSYEATKDSDIVVITAGLARKPGMSRDDLVVKNSFIVSSCTENAVKYSPNAIYIIVSNPLDVMTYIAREKAGIDRHKFIGMAGVLDTARYRSFIAMELNCSVQDVHGVILGSHGDSMVPLPRYTTVAGIPLTTLMSKEKIDAICDRAANGGAEIVKYLQTGSAYYAPASSVVHMIESIVKDQHRILPCSVLLDGEYGVHDVVVGVPVKLGKNCVEQVLELDLSEEESKKFHDSVNHVDKMIKEAKEILSKQSK